MRMKCESKLGEFMRISCESKLSQFFRIVFALISIIVISIIFAPSPVWAAFTPQFGVEISDTTADAHSTILLRISQTSGDDPFKKVTFTVPVGFDIASLADLAASLPSGFPLEPATGIFCMAGCQGVQVLNLANISGHKAVWRLSFATLPLLIDVVLDGEVASGHRIIFEWPADFLPKLETPLNLDFIIAGQILNVEPKASVVTNPERAGELIWKAEVVSRADQVKILEAKPEKLTSSTVQNLVSLQKTPKPEKSPQPLATITPVGKTPIANYATTSAVPTKTTTPHSAWLLRVIIVLFVIFLGAKIVSFVKKRKRRLHRRLKLNR